VAKLTKTQLRKFRQHLLQYLEHLGVKIEHLEDAVLRSDADAAPEDGDDFGDGGGSRESQVGIIENEGEILLAVQDALGRMREGVYGLCQHCENPIPVGRLEALPYARYCMEHQEQFERGELELN
jgi:DnaK suppressor protein